MKTPESGTSPAKHQPKSGPRDLPVRKSLWPAIVASGACSVLAAPASALQLGSVDVQSSLGQPLRASIAFALSPNEQLHDYCIFLQPPAAGMPGVRDAVIGVANGRIVIRGTTPLKEPIVSLGVAVNCPYTARLARSYTLMIDPAPANVQEPSAVTAAPAPAARPASTQPSAVGEPPARSTPAASSRQSDTAIEAGTYQVRPGDTLSDIVARIENRSVGIWSAVGIVFDANPDAFIDGDMNRLKAGSLLTIPSLDGESVARVSAAATEAAPVSLADPAVDDRSTATVEAPPATAAIGIDTAPAAPVATTSDPTAASGPVEAAQTTFDETVDLQPGEAVAVTPAVEIAPVDIPAIGAGNDVAQNPGATTAEPARAAGEASPSWLYWTLGALGLFGVALAIFGWRSRRQTPPDATVAAAQAAEDDAPTVRDEALDFDVHGDSLDLDLDDGAGFRSVGDVEVAQDFGFSTSRDLGADLDMVLPAAEAKDGDNGSSTDILPILPTEEHTILEREILPSDDDDEDGDYDVSMIVDATKQKFSADRDVTTKDLNVVAIDGDDDEETGEYTLSNEVDYQILEQDYEDELTATQALNAEILKAAQDLQARIETGTEDATSTNEVTSLLDQADADADLGETLDEELELTTEKTVEMAADDGDQTLETRVIEGQDGEELEEFVDDRTAEIPEARIESRKADDTHASTQRLSDELTVAGNDDTAEIEVETGHFKTRKSAG